MKRAVEGVVINSSSSASAADMAVLVSQLQHEVVQLQHDVAQQKQQITALTQKNSSQTPTDPIVLNVGGVKYLTTLNTLCKFDSFFRGMFGGDIPRIPSSDGSFFIDRDGRNFGIILNFLRDGEFDMPVDDREVAQLYKEASFYGLEDLMQVRNTYLHQKEKQTIMNLISNTKNSVCWDNLMPIKRYGEIMKRSVQLKNDGKLLIVTNEFGTIDVDFSRTILATNSTLRSALPADECLIMRNPFDLDLYLHVDAGLVRVFSMSDTVNPKAEKDFFEVGGITWISRTTIAIGSGDISEWNFQTDTTVFKTVTPFDLVSQLVYMPDKDLLFARGEPVGLFVITWSDATECYTELDLDYQHMQCFGNTLACYNYRTIEVEDGPNWKVVIHKFDDNVIWLSDKYGVLLTARDKSSVTLCLTDRETMSKTDALLSLESFIGVDIIETDELWRLVVATDEEIFFNTIYKKDITPF